MEKRTACAHDIRLLLKDRYCAPEWVLAEEVRNAAGFEASRSADAIAMSLWPSRGCVVHGFEIKVDRGDWKRELADPAKADALARFCDHWWVAAARGVVPIDELPENWGLMEAHSHGDGWRLKVIKVAPKLAAREWSRTFMAAFVARMARTEESEVNRRVMAEVKKREKGREESFDLRVKEAVGRANRRAEELEKLVKDFEDESGISLRKGYSTDNAREVGAAVRMVLKSGVLSSYQGLSEVAGRMERSAERIRKALHEMSASKPIDICTTEEMNDDMDEAEVEA